MSPEQLLPYLVAAAVAGAGLVTGLLFAFSNFVMRALADLEPAQGMLAMQRINERILNPLFLLFFLGTPLLCLAIGVHGLVHMSEPGSGLLFTGALLYLVGPLGITVLRNVPLNDELAAVPPAEGAALWARYQVDWQRWNHVRTYLGLTSILLLCVGLGRL